MPGESMIMRAFYPLTLPLTVDPGAISVAITIGANHAHGVERVLIAIIARASSARAIISASVWLAYRYAPRVAHWLGHTRVMVVLRLSAFIVLCIGVEITWNGVKALASEIVVRAADARRATRRPRRRDRRSARDRAGRAARGRRADSHRQSAGQCADLPCLTADLTGAERAGARAQGCDQRLRAAASPRSSRAISSSTSSASSVPVLQLAGGLVVASLGFSLLHDSGEGAPRRRRVTSATAHRRRRRSIR